LVEAAQGCGMTIGIVPVTFFAACVAGVVLAASSQTAEFANPKNADCFPMATL